MTDAAARRRARESPGGQDTARETRRSRFPAVALGLVAAGAFLAYALLAIAVDVPRVHPDEVRYVIAASSLVEGEGLGRLRAVAVVQDHVIGAVDLHAILGHLERGDEDRRRELRLARRFSRDPTTGAPEEQTRSEEG